MTTIAGKLVLLTGASGGIGVSIARALAREQATIVGISRSQEGLERVGQEVKTLGGKWFALPYDLSRVEELPVLIEKIDRQVGSVEILINNAGIEIYRAFQDYSAAELQLVLSTNLLSAMELSRLVLPGMLSQKSGHIINMASLAAKKGHPYDSIYSASKAGLLMWSDAVRQELVGTGVEVSAICPGYISGRGMFADTGIPAPSLSGTSTPEDVAIAVIRAIQNNKAEAIVNQDFISESLTKILLALWQLSPPFGDAVYRWIGVTKLNRKRVENQKQTGVTPEIKVPLQKRIKMP